MSDPADTQPAGTPAADRPEPRLSGPDTCQIPCADPDCGCCYPGGLEEAQPTGEEVIRYAASAAGIVPAAHRAVTQAVIHGMILDGWRRPAAAGPHPDTPDRPGVLGRALIDDRGHLWWPRPERERSAYGRPVRKVLLVSPAAWERRERLADAAWQWRAADLVQADPSRLKESAYEVEDRDQALREALRQDAETDRLSAEEDAEPAPEPAGDGPGWEATSEQWRAAYDAKVQDLAKETLRAADVTADRDRLLAALRETAVQARAARADRGRLARELEHAKSDRQDLWDTRDKRNHRWMEAAERYQEERDTARAEAERWQRQHDFRYAELQERYRDLSATRAELAVVADDRDRHQQHATATAGKLVEEHLAYQRALDELDQARAELAEVTADRDQRQRLVESYVVAHRQFEATIRDLRAELATARRDAAADALRMAASFARSRAASEEVPPERRMVHSEYAVALDTLADEVFAGTRPVPGSPESARAVRLGAGQDAARDDLAAILRELGLGDHARPISPHQVVQDEVLPAIRQLRLHLAVLRLVTGPGIPTDAAHEAEHQRMDEQYRRAGEEDGS